MSWISISLRVKPALADMLGEALIAGGSVGVWESEPGRVTAYFPAETDPSAVQALLEELAVSLGPGEGVILPVGDQDWIASWKASVTPLRVTPRLVIVPSWQTYQAEPGERVVVLDPGMAFGTGHHETTRMCLELLDERLRRGDAPVVLDLGTGSGILAIAAALLGAERVVAADIDPVARAAAEENVRANAVASIIVVKDGDDAWRWGPYDLVVANLTADDLRALLPRINEVLARNGCAILSGILVSREATVADALRQLGLPVAERRELGEWVALTAVGSRCSSD